MEFKVEKFAVVRSELEGLIHQHWREVSGDAFRPLDINWPQYYVLDQAGMLFVLTARVEGRMIGYVIHLLYRPLHYRYSLMASDDAHFLLPEYRRGTAAWRMFKAVEQQLRQLGVDIVTYHTKYRADIDRSKVFERLGYTQHEKIMVKRI
jgi:GNAT superfamily N-acetyltransferase